MPWIAASPYCSGFSESSLWTWSDPSGALPTTSVNVPPRSIQNCQPTCILLSSTRSRGSWLYRPAVAQGLSLATAGKVPLTRRGWRDSSQGLSRHGSAQAEALETIPGVARDPAASPSRRWPRPHGPDHAPCTTSSMASRSWPDEPHGSVVRRSAGAGAAGLPAARGSRGSACGDAARRGLDQHLAQHARGPSTAGHGRALPRLPGEAHRHHGGRSRGGGRQSGGDAPQAGLGLHPASTRPG